MVSRRSLLAGLASLRMSTAWAEEMPDIFEDTKPEPLSSIEPVWVVPRLPIEGNPEAGITIVEFSDFQCSYCKSSHDTMVALLERFPSEIRYQYRQLPLEFHPGAPVAARYYEAVASLDQRAAVTLRSRVFGDLSSFNRDPERFLDRQVAALGLDVNKVRTLSRTSGILEVIELDKSIAKARGLSGTPAFVVMGPKDGGMASLYVEGSQPVEYFENIVLLFLGRTSNFTWKK